MLTDRFPPMPNWPKPSGSARERQRRDDRPLARFTPPNMQNSSSMLQEFGADLVDVANVREELAVAGHDVVDVDTG